MSVTIFLEGQVNIFITDIDNLTFADIESFCKEKQVEGINLEYKREFPKRGLAKQFAYH
jgi:hypothetical protein